MKIFFILSTLTAACTTAFAQTENHVTWSYGVKKIGSNGALILLKASIDPGWHIYSLYLKKNRLAKTSIDFAKSNAYTRVGKTREPKALIRYENSFGTKVGCFENRVIFWQKMRLLGKKVIIKGLVTYAIGNDKKCQSPEVEDFSINVP